MKRAVLFPGQGSQSVGMGKTLYESNDAARIYFDKADAILGYSLTEIMFNGPDETLAQTMYTQPCIFVHSVATWFGNALLADSVSGHSLGEFSALVAAGVLSFEDGLKIVEKRGKLMQAAGETAPGAMAAVVGMPDADVEAICKAVSAEFGKPVVPANYNSPGQLVISGDVAAVDEAIVRLQTAGCKIVKKLNVSGAFHSPLMESAKGSFATFVDGFSFSDAKIPVYQNVSAQKEISGKTIKAQVIEQLTSPVKWTQILHALKGAGCTEFVECGPGKVLQGLVKRTLTEVTILGNS